MILTTFTNDIVSGITWSGGTHKSDAWTTAEVTGGSIVRKLGAPTTQEQITLTGDASTVQKVHIGTWLTEASSPETIVIPATATFAFNEMRGYVTAGQVDANIYVKVSVLSDTGGTLAFDRTIIDWSAIQKTGSPILLGSTAASPLQMGGTGSATGYASFIESVSGATIAIGERLAIEIAFDITANRNGDSANFEFGSNPNIADDATLISGAGGTGAYGSGVGLPLTLSEANQDVWSGHSEIEIPWVAGTETIAWADVGTDWSTAKWGTTGAKRYVNRFNGVATSQMWIFQDDDYLYVALNNIIDGCIQTSDHHEIMICAGTDWQGSLETDPDDWIFRRDITAGTSATRDWVSPILGEKTTDQGEYVLQGSAAATFPENWELPTFDIPSRTFTFASNSYTWQDGVDFRHGGTGACSTCPQPPGSGTGGAYSEFKIKKSKLNNWNGTDPIGFMANLQCDVQGNGHTMFPTVLGNQVDKADWFWCGAVYPQGIGKTAAGTKGVSVTTVETMDLRPLMMSHAHAPELGSQTHSPTTTVTSSTTSSNSTLSRKMAPSSTSTISSSTSDSILSVAHEYNPSTTISVSTSTSDANFSVGGVINPTTTLSLSTSTSDATLARKIEPSSALSIAFSSSNAIFSIAKQYSPQATGTIATSTSNAKIVRKIEPSTSISTSTFSSNASLGTPTYFPATSIATILSSTTDVSLSVAHEFNPSTIESISVSTTDSILVRKSERSTSSLTSTSTSNATLSRLIKPSTSISIATSTSNASITTSGEINPSTTVSISTGTSDAVLSRKMAPGSISSISMSTSDATLGTPTDINPTATTSVTIGASNASLDIAHEYNPSTAESISISTSNAALNRSIAPSTLLAVAMGASDADLSIQGSVRPTTSITTNTFTSDAKLSRKIESTSIATTSTSTSDANLSTPGEINSTTTVIVTTSTSNAKLVRKIAPTTIASVTTTSTDALLDISGSFRPTASTGTSISASDAKLTRAIAPTVTTNTDISSSDATLNIAKVINPTTTISVTTSTGNSVLSVAHKYEVTSTALISTITSDATMTAGLAPTQEVDVIGIPSEEAFGSPRASLQALPWKKPEATGGGGYVSTGSSSSDKKKKESKKKISVSADSIESEESFGSPKIEVGPTPSLSASSIDTEEVFGRVEIEVGVSPDDEAILLMFMELAA